MPADKDFKRLVRARMGKTGEAYTTARAHLRPTPDTDPGPTGPLRGRHPDTAALTRLLAALGATDPGSGRPLGEAMVLGVAGGIGFAYFVFEYEELTTLYLGGRINPFVHKRDPAEAALARLGVPFQVRRTSGPATAERQLRAALDQGRLVLATVDPARLPHRGVPPDLAAAAAAGIADTRAGMLDPPMRNFGVPGLAKWAELLTAPRDPKGWPRLLAAPGRQRQLLTWLYDWVETAGTGGGFF